MKKEHAEIICIIDRSGSMRRIQSDAIGGFNTFLDQQKKEPGTARLTLVLFDHEYNVVLKRVPLTEVLELTDKTYVPRGMTALLDAMGKSMESTAARIMETPEKDRPEKVIFAILTDGLENASKEYSLRQVFSTISRQKEINGWEFTYLAADQDAIKVGESMGIMGRDNFSFRSTPEGTTAAFNTLSEEVSRKRRMSSK